MGPKNIHHSTVAGINNNTKKHFVFFDLLRRVGTMSFFLSFLQVGTTFMNCFSEFLLVSLKDKPLPKESTLNTFALRMVKTCFECKRLKVGSCPNNDNSVQISFCPFLCSI